MSSLPVYPEPSDDYVYKLGMVRYPPWKLSCRNSEAYSLSEAYYYISLNSLRETTDLEVSLLVVLVMVTGIVSSGISLVKHGYELKSKINSNTHYVPESELDRINPNYRSQTNYCYEVFKVILFMILEIVLIIVICVHLGTI